MNDRKKSNINDINCNENALRIYYIFIDKINDRKFYFEIYN